MKRKASKDLLGYLIFFLVIASIVSIAFVVYELVRDKSEGIISLVMLGAIITISVLCTLFDAIRRKITVNEPVNEILLATEKIACGRFDTRLEPRHAYDKYDSFDLIMENLNAMAKELSKSEILKNDFISNVSHEIKTPISIIKSYASLLKNEKDEEKRKKYCEIILEASNRLTSLVGNILKLNKLENHELMLEYEEVRLEDSLAEAVLSLEGVIENKEIALECNFEDATIVSVKSYLDIVWSNLLSNAIKFTDRGGKINISVKKLEDGVIVSITDTGCGIDSETGKRIFDKFYQGETSHSGEGNGLGLALVKRVIDILGGEISVKSELGKGSTFSVALKNEGSD